MSSLKGQLRAPWVSKLFKFCIYLTFFNAHPFTYFAFVGKHFAQIEVFIFLVKARQYSVLPYFSISASFALCKFVRLLLAPYPQHHGKLSALFPSAFAKLSPLELEL